MTGEFRQKKVTGGYKMALENVQKSTRFLPFNKSDIVQLVHHLSLKFRHYFYKNIR